MGSGNVPGPLGTGEPSPFDLRNRGIREFDGWMAAAQILSPALPLPAQKAIAVAANENKTRWKDLYTPAPKQLPLVDAAFTRGPPAAPTFDFDHGFLDRELANHRHVVDDSKRQPPTAADVRSYRLWEGAALSALALRPDLADAVLAYLHFLWGGGTPYRFRYDIFVTTDGCGKRVLASAIEDTKRGVRELGLALAQFDAAAWEQTFDIRSGAVPVGGGDRYPYPATENWQKTIGGHGLWISAHVAMELDPMRHQARFDVAMTLHAVDMYNFDPHKHDVTSGISDAANGRFEITGLGREFVQTGEAQARFECESPLPPARGVGVAP